MLTRCLMSSDIDFISRRLSEINTFDPFHGGERVVPESIEDFLCELCQRRPKNTEGGKEELGDEASMPATVYLDSSGTQYLQDGAGNVFLQMVVQFKEMLMES